MIRVEQRTVFLFLLALTMVVVPPAIGKAQGEYSITVGGNAATVSIRTRFYENMTISSLPNYTLALLGSNASNAKNIFISAINQLTNGISISSLEIYSSSAGNIISTTVNFTLDGSISHDQYGSKINMAWKSFKITDDIRAANQSLNFVGTYLSSSPFLRRTSTRTETWAYYEDGTPVPSLSSPQAASSFSIFDFSSLSNPLSSWPVTFSPLNGTTQWTNSLNHNITILENIGTGSAVTTAAFVASDSQNVKVAIPGIDQTIRDTVFTGLNTPTAVMLFILMLVLPVVGIATYLLDRKLSRSYRVTAKKKRGRQPGR